MDALIIENVRCFGTRQDVPIRPLTILVGENSAGKSTFLALFRLAHSLCRGIGTPDFNEKPFLLGAFEQIAHYYGGRGGRAKALLIGARVGTEHPVTITGTFTERSVQPVLEEWRLEAESFKLSATSALDGFKLSLQTPGGTARDLSGLTIGSAGPGGFPVRALANIFRPVPAGSTSPGEVAVLHRLLRNFGGPDFSQAPYAFAPVRSEPERTYDRLQEVPEPEGSHVPMILARLQSEGEQAWTDLNAALSNFGKSSGLLEEITVRRKGTKASDPFQVHVSFGTFHFNLIDVGYGVSQVLPILVESLLGKRQATFLMQQPEVHLHPRAQAELGSFLGDLASKKNKRIVVETHSDYLLDRVRMDVRDKKLPSAQVQILFFERFANDVTIHPISIDAEGELVGAPASYREFFLEEQRRFLLGPGKSDVRDRR